jgi:hypothetical protein
LATLYYLLAFIFVAMAVWVIATTQVFLLPVNFLEMRFIVSLGTVMALFSILPVSALFFLGLAQGQRSRKRLIRSGWKAEKVQVEHEITQDKVAALEAKINTLETALSESIKRHSAR